MFSRLQIYPSSTRPRTSYLRRSKTRLGRTGVLRLALVAALLLNAILASLVATPAIAAPVAQSDGLAPYVHPEGLFEARFPVAFTLEEVVPADDVMSLFPDAENGFAMAFANPLDMDSAVVVILLDMGALFADYFAWEAVIDDLLNEAAGERLTYLQVDTDEATLYAYLTVRSRQNDIFTVKAFGEGSLIGIALGASLLDWDLYGDDILASVDSFTWDPQAVADYLSVDVAQQLPTPAPTPQAPRRVTATPTPEAVQPDSGLTLFTPSDGLYTLLIPPNFYEEERDFISGRDVYETFPWFTEVVLAFLIDAEDIDSVIILFFMAAQETLDLRDPIMWEIVVPMLTAEFSDAGTQVETLIDDADAFHFRQRMSDGEYSFYFDVQADDDFVVMAIAGGANWEALQDDLLISLDSLTWDRAVVLSNFTAAPLPVSTPQPTPELLPEPTAEPLPEPTPELLPEPTAEPLPEPTPAPMDEDGFDPSELLPIHGLEFDAPVVHGFLDLYQRLADTEGIFSVWAPARLRGEAEGGWEGGVYSTYYTLWTADALYEELYYSTYLSVVGPANEIMAGQSGMLDGEMLEPSFAVPSVEEWMASVDAFATQVLLPEDALIVRHPIPGDDYGVLFYAEATDEEDESYRMWTYMTQQDGLGIVLFLLGPLVEPEDIPVHADADVRFPTPIDLGLESFTWDLDAAKAALHEHLAQRYTNQELAAISSRLYQDPLGGVELQIPTSFMGRVRTLEPNAYTVGFRELGSMNGLVLRFTDVGERLSAEDWGSLQEQMTGETAQVLNQLPSDPAPEILDATVFSEEYNYSRYELAGTAAHALVEYLEIDGLFATSIAIAELDDWDRLEGDLRHMLDTFDLDSAQMLANLEAMRNQVGALAGFEVLSAPHGPGWQPDQEAETDSDTDPATDPTTEPDTDANSGFTPFQLSAIFVGDALETHITLVMEGPDGAVIGQISGPAQGQDGGSPNLTLTTDPQGYATALINFVPSAPWQPGPHTAWLYLDDILVGEVGFVVAGPVGSAADYAAITEVSLTAVDADARAVTDADHVFAPDDTLHYRFTLAAPDGDHQIRLVAYHEGVLIQDVTHAWRLPYGAYAWTGDAALRPQDGWLPGEHTLHLWVNGLPWDVQTFSIVDVDPDAEAYLDGLNTVPLTPESAGALAVQALLEPVGGLDYIDMIYVDGGRALATLNLENELVVYDTATWRELYRYGTGVFGWNLTTDGAGSRLAVAFQDLAETGDHFPILVWDTASWGPPVRLEGHGGAVTAMSFDPNGQWLVSAALDLTLRTWSLQGEPATAFPNPGLESGPLVVTALDVSADGSRVAMTYSDGIAEMYRLELAPGASRIQPLYPFEVGGRDTHLLRMFPAAAQQDPGVAAAFGAPQMLVVAANEVQVWTYYDQVAELVYALPDRLGAAAFSPDAQLLAVGGSDSYIVDTISGEIVAALDYPTIQRIHVSAAGQIALLDGAGNLYILAPVAE